MTIQALDCMQDMTVVCEHLAFNIATCTALPTCVVTLKVRRPASHQAGTNS